ncbi:hypothetical protein [Cutibacterium sp. V947]|uniref:hypothetical protein n=1 Tax=unclassified Cutibacterium TaxID=2649671 RepID=UPI003EDFF52C
MTFATTGKSVPTPASWSTALHWERFSPVPTTPSPGLAHHPEAPRKHGAEVAVTVVALIPEWGTRNFHAIREDWSTDNWYIKKRITNLRPDSRSNREEQSSLTPPISTS